MQGALLLHETFAGTLLSAPGRERFAVAIEVPVRGNVRKCTGRASRESSRGDFPRVRYFFKFKTCRVRYFLIEDFYKVRYFAA